MKIKRKDLNRLIESFLKEAGTDPKGFRKDLGGEKTEPRINPDNPDEMQAALDAAEESNISDLHIGQFGAQRGDPGRRKISFGPSAEFNPNPAADDITTIPVGYPDDPTPNQARHGQEYMQNYHGVGKEDNMYSIHDTRTQSFQFDDSDEDTVEDDYGALGKTDPSISYDDHTPEVGITLKHDRFEGDDPDDFDLSISDIDRDYGTFEDDDDEDTDDDTDDDEGFLAKIRKFLSGK